MPDLIRRITPLTILPDIAPAVQQYRTLGFVPVETGDPGCMGLQAGTSTLLLATEKFMTGDFHQTSITPLVGQTIPYIYVRSIAVALDRLSAASTIIEQVVTRHGSLEALVEQGGQTLLLAEKRESANASPTK